MPEPSSFLQGMIVDRITSRAAGGLRVEVFMDDDRLGAGVSDAAGEFVAPIKEVDPKLRALHLHFRVFRGDTPLGDAPPRLVLRRRQGFEQVFLELDLDLPPEPVAPPEPPAPEPPPEPEVVAQPVPTPIPVPSPMTRPVEALKPQAAVVRGHLATTDGRPVRRTRLRVLRRDLRDEHELVEGTTGADGGFELDLPDDAPLDGSLDLLFLVLDAEDEERGRSRLIIGVRPGQWLDVRVPESAVPRLPERRIVAESLAEHLADLSPAELSVGDISYLARKTGLPASRVGRYALAEGLARKTGMDAAVLYGLARQGMSAGLDALLAHPRPALRRAIERAVQEELVEPDVAKRLDSVLDALVGLGVERTLSAKPGEPASLAAILAEAGLSREQRAVALRLAQQQQPGAPASAFWSALSRAQILPDASSYIDARVTVQLAHLTLGYLPLIRALRQTRGAGRWTEPRHLTRLELSDWEALMTQEVDGTPVSVPRIIPGATEGERRGRYARLLRHILEEAYPNAAVAAALGRYPALAGQTDPFKTGAKQLVLFLETYPEHDLRKMGVRQWLAADNVNIPYGLDEETLTRDLERLQRCLLLAPAGDRARVTALLLREGLDSARAVRRLGRRGFRKRMAANLDADTADAVYDRARAIAAGALALYGAYRNQREAAQLLASGKPGESAPPGSSPDWQTLFGPDDAPAVGETLSLLGRAAYLVDLLSFLEQRQAGQSNRSALDLLLARRPELQHLVLSGANASTPVPAADLANEVLEAVVAADYKGPSKRDQPRIAAPEGWPQTAGAAEALAAYPEHLDARAYEVLREAAFPLSLPFDLWRADLRQTLTHLGVSRAELMARLRGGPDRLAWAAEALVLEPAALEIVTRSTTDDPEALASRWGLSESGMSRLQGVPELLRRTGVQYAELQELLGLRYVDRRGRLGIELGSDPLPGGGSTPSGDPARAKVPRLQWPEADRLQRFLRLARASALADWGYAELDQAIEVLGDGSLTGELVVRLADLDALRQTTRVPVPELLSWYGPLDTRPDPSGTSPYARIFQLGGGATAADSALAIGANGEPAAAGQPIRNHAQAVRAALGISAEDLELLLDGPVEDRVALANLSHLYRLTSLARAARTSLRELLVLLDAWVDPPVLTPSEDRPEPAMTRAFFADLALMRECGQSIGDVVAMLSGGSPPSEEERARVDRQLEQLRQAVHEATEDEEGAAGSVAEQVVLARLSELIELPLPLTDVLVHKTIRAPRGSSVPVFSQFFDPALVKGSGGLALWRRSLARLQRAATVVRVMGLDAAEIAWLTDRDTSWGLIDLDALPLPGDPPVTFSAWRNLARLVGLRHQLGASAAEVVKLLELAAAPLRSDESPDRRRAALLEALSERTGLPRADLEALADAGPDGTRPPLKSGGLERLLEAADVVRRLGAPASDALAFAGDDVTSDLALRARLAARAIHGPASWGEVAGPLRDALRARQRSALLAYLAGTRAGLDDPSGVLAHYALDADPAPGAGLTRVEHAIASVQRFAQRCLLNREPDVPLDGDSAVEWAGWEAIGSFAAWQANRAALLEPERFIEPDLRDDKTPFFEQLERSLLQGEVTGEAAAQAVREYVAQLEAVAGLSIAAIHVEEPNRLHLFGRTQTGAAQIWYRRRDDGRFWTPWERVGVEVDGEHLLPLVVDGRLYLFWAVFAEAARAHAEDPERWLVRLAWSRRDSNGWTPKRVSAPGVLTSDRRPLQDHYLRAAAGDPPVIWLLADSEAPDFEEAIGTFAFDPLREVAAASRLAPSAGAALARQDAFGANAQRRCQGVELTGPDEPLWAPVALVADLQPPQFDLVLGRSVGHARLTYPVQYGRYVFQAPLVYQDAARAFLIEPEGPLPTHAPSFGLPDVSLLAPVDLPVLTTPHAGNGSAPKRRISVPALALVGVEEPGLAPEPTDHGRTTRDDIASVGGWAAIEDLAEGLVNGRPSVEGERRFRFSSLSHSQARTFARRVERGGVDDLLQPRGNDAEAQALRRRRLRGDFDFRVTYQPTTRVPGPMPVDDTDFGTGGAWAQYNWELFFHVPFWVATQLSRHQRFAEAQRWFHAIFDPTDRTGDPAPARFWKLRPFFEHFERIGGRQRPIHELIAIMAGATGEEADNLRRELRNRIAAWRRHPFDPHAIAHVRLEAYMRAVVLRYVENLLGWGDALLQRGTSAATAEANELHSLAAQLLGAKSERLAAPGAAPVTVGELRARLESLSSTVAGFETAAGLVGEDPGWARGRAGELPELLTPLFGLPRSERLEDLRARVAARLSTAAADAPPVRTRAAAPPARYIARLSQPEPDASQADIGAPLPVNRFQASLRKAYELATDLRSLGQAILSALERRDAEALATLRAGQEADLLESLRTSKQAQVDEAKAVLGALQQAQLATEARRRYYSGRPYMNVRESLHLELGTAGGEGRQQAVRAGMLAAYDRRAEEWKLQEALAGREMAQIEARIAAAGIRLAAAERDLEGHRRHVAQLRESHRQMADRFTHAELYGWMLGQLGTIHFAACDLAFRTARRAERAFQFELGQPEARFIHAGHWDHLRHALLAGEHLFQDLRRMETAYLERSRRDFELAKQVSLSLIAPDELLRLQETGVCTVSLPEWLFDLDFPGHVLRRLRSVAVTLVGGGNATLRLVSSRVRTAEDKEIDLGPPATTAVAVSGRSELGRSDDRYQPFEGAGAASTWQLELPLEAKSPDRKRITDVVMHLEYTAREGSPARRDEARRDAEARLSRGVFSRLVNLPREHATAWQRFLNPVQGASHHRLELDLSGAKLGGARIQSLELVMRFAEGREYPGAGGSLAVELLDPAGAAIGPVQDLVQAPPEAGRPSGARAVFAVDGAKAQRWFLRITSESIAVADDRLVRPPKEGEARRLLEPELWSDAWVLVHFSAGDA